jgi:hypothetical protein
MRELSTLHFSTLFGLFRTVSGSWSVGPRFRNHVRLHAMYSSNSITSGSRAESQPTFRRNMSPQSWGGGIFRICLLLPDVLLGLFFDPEHGGGVFDRNAG